MGQSSGPGRGKFFLEVAPQIDIRDGIAHVTAESGDAEIVMACTPHVLLVAIERAQRAYDVWAASHRGAQGIKGDHAARS